MQDLKKEELTLHWLLKPWLNTRNILSGGQNDEVLTPGSP